MSSLDVTRIRSHFDFPAAGRVVTNNAASTQPPRELTGLLNHLTPWYENVHRGQSAASRRTTAMFEASFDTIAAWLNAPSRRCVATYRNTTEAINAVMYSLLTEFRDGDNVVTTMIEHNSNYVPWHALCREILPRLGRRVECRLARFDAYGNLDLDHLASLVDDRTRLVCCSGASNFFGSKPDLCRVRKISADKGARLLVDAAQLAPTSAIDVQALDVDYLAFSFHKMLAPFGVGVLYAKEEHLASSLPFLYGGDMVAEGGVTPETVAWNDLPWKYTAGTPNILGTILSAQALRLLIDLVMPTTFFGGAGPLPRVAIEEVMTRVNRHTAELTARCMAGLSDIPNLLVYGPEHRTPLVSFNLAGVSPFTVAEALDRRGVEARAGCHCATLAHRALGLDPPASCRLSFALYNTVDDVDRAIEAVREVAARYSTVTDLARLRC
jgi:cysteine desulfurase/selenocysteine lyase